MGLVIKKTNTMTKEIEVHFKYKGDDYYRVDKSDKGYIYKREHAGIIYYEVFEIKESEILSDFENKIGSGEFKHRYPKDEDFGVWAWCFKGSLWPALDKFNSL